jgi:hypothetical protein
MLDCALVYKEINWVEGSNTVLIHCETQTDSAEDDEKYLYSNVGAIQWLVFFVVNHSREEEKDGAR